LFLFKKSLFNIIFKDVATYKEKVFIKCLWGEKGVFFVEVNFVGGFIQLYIIAISSKGKIDL